MSHWISFQVQVTSIASLHVFNICCYAFSRLTEIPLLPVFTVTRWKYRSFVRDSSTTFSPSACRLRYQFPTNTSIDNKTQNNCCLHSNYIKWLRKLSSRQKLSTNEEINAAICNNRNVINPYQDCVSITVFWSNPLSSIAKRRIGSLDSLGPQILFVTHMK